jgi:hypothetical protein
MPADSLPMVRVVWERGRVKEIEISPAAGKLLLRTLIVLALACFLATGVLTWEQIASASTVLKVW